MITWNFLDSNLQNNFAIRNLFFLVEMDGKNLIILISASEDVSYGTLLISIGKKS